MTVDQILDRVLIPRANGSAGLEQVAAFLAERLQQSGASVAFQEFAATPHGFALTWTAALALMAGYVAAIAARRYALALLLVVATAGLLLLEFEALRSPVSGLLPAPERNVVGSFPARAGAPTLVFSAHYDTTTHFGDHFDWRRFGFLQGPATAAAVALALAGLVRRRRAQALPRRIALGVALACTVPFAAMFWFQAVGPLLRTPSVGAIDNGGAVAALLRLSERLAGRPADAPVAVQLVLFAAEEERALGSLAFARSLDPSAPVAAINLEAVGASDSLVLVDSDGFALRRFASPEPLVSFVEETARELRGDALPRRAMLAGTLTDGRSFLARGVPAVTLLGLAPEGLPRHLHSWRDSRDRLRSEAIERCVELLAALVRRADEDPRRMVELGRRESMSGQRGR